MAGKGITVGVSLACFRNNNHQRRTTGRDHVTKHVHKYVNEKKRISQYMSSIIVC